MRQTNFAHVSVSKHICLQIHNSLSLSLGQLFSIMAATECMASVLAMMLMGATNWLMIADSTGVIGCSKAPLQ